jgi:archaellum component FlaD/FlaE
VQAQGKAGANTELKAQDKAGTTTEQNAQDKSGTTTEQNAQDKSGTTTEQNAQDKSGTTTEQNAQGQTGTTTEQNAQGQTQDQNSTASITNVTTEQKTEIVNVIREEHVEPVDVDFSVSVGVEVPRTVTLHRLPARIVKIVPAYKTYEYFVLADGRIVIVDPDSLEIVFILSA